MFCDYQINLGNATNLNSSLSSGWGGGEGEIFNISGKGGAPYMKGPGILLGDL